MVNSISDDTDKIVEIKTVQSNAIRILFEALKDILTDVNLQISNEGLKIISMDGSKQAIVNLKLDATKLEKFYCLNSIMLNSCLYNQQYIYYCIYAYYWF